MAHIVGVPKREPCQQCGKPVFFAERLTIGKFLFHRTCLKCARCETQLTPGSFYETEIDGVYCCETCPDEEKRNDAPTESRQSFSEKLAMFQTNGKGLLQKSMSDEEKSKSLKRLGELSGIYKNPIHEDDKINESCSTASSDMKEQDSSESESEEDVEPPSLPKTQPPSLDQVSIAQKPQLPPKQNALNKLKMQNNKPQFDIKPANECHQSTSIPSIVVDDHSSENTKSQDGERNSPIQQMFDSAKNLEETTTSIPNGNDSILQNETSSEALGDFTDVTKEINEMMTENNINCTTKCTESTDEIAEQSANVTDGDEMECEQSENAEQKSINHIDLNENKFNDKQIDKPDNDASIDDVHIRRNSTDSNQMVRSRLSQFEALLQSESGNTTTHKCNDSPRLKKRTPVSIESRTKPMEQDQEEISKENAIAIIKTDNGMPAVNDNEPPTIVDKPTPLKRVTSDSSTPPTPARRRNRVTVVETPVEQSSEENVPINAQEKTEYPDDLNPFGSDDEEENDDKHEIQLRKNQRKSSLNPFDSDDDEIELLKKSTPKKVANSYRVSTNPFGSDTEDDEEESSKRTPVPTPRKPINGSSLHSTPEPSPRMSHTLNPRMQLSKMNDFYGSNASLTSNSRLSATLNRSNQVHGSMTSLASTPRHKKGRAPDIPNSIPSLSANSSPSHSIRATPISKKKRAAPLPPKLATQHNISNDSLAKKPLEDSFISIETENSVNLDTSIESPFTSSSISASNGNVDSTLDQSLDTKSENSSVELNNSIDATKTLDKNDSQRKLIPADSSLLDDFTMKNIAERTADEKIVYRRKIFPDRIVTPDKAVDRQCEKMKENKESQNKNRQSQVVMPLNVLVNESIQLYSPNKSSFGKWKRRKGPAPSLPVPARKVIQMLPLQEIRHELEVIEVQQQGLEKQGVILEKMIRERCEGTENENKPLEEFKPNSKEVEDLILQLFELVNEKNELFRRQAELMYLRRQHRLEQEQADIEYEIRVLMAQPECNKTDSDKAREEALISRMVEVVQLRNEVIESLEMDRKREAEEDQSIKEQLELHTAKREEELSQQTPVKLSKKEKKKQKESKKLAKQKKMDADKDADESEIGESEKVKDKKKKKKFLF